MTDPVRLELLTVMRQTGIDNQLWLMTVVVGILQDVRFPVYCLGISEWIMPKLGFMMFTWAPQPVQARYLPVFSVVSQQYL